MTSSPILGLCAALAFCGLSSAASAQAPSAPMITVDIKSFSFQPMVINLPVGGLIRWRNLDGEPHTVVSLGGAFRSGALDQGDSFTFKFLKPGIYAYICSIHPQMKASIVVQ